MPCLSLVLKAGDCEVAVFYLIAIIMERGKNPGSETPHSRVKK